MITIFIKNFAMNHSIDIEGLIGADISEFQKKYCKHPLCCVKEIPKDAIIFIGINPSISEEDRANIHNISNKIYFYKHSLIKGDSHKYFRRFFDIVAEIDSVPWGHFDLLFFQETNQAEVKNMLNDKYHKTYIWEQLLISRRILDTLIEEGSPKVIVVNNTLARMLLGFKHDKNNNKDEWLGYKFEWDDNIGTYRYKNIPFFFTSMLTGQRALDIGSFERLRWHIKNIILGKLK